MADKRPNILVMFGDDIGWFNIGAYNLTTNKVS
jgi:arylsulfatase A-like enzyme